MYQGEDELCHKGKTPGLRKKQYFKLFPFNFLIFANDSSTISRHFLLNNSIWYSLRSEWTLLIFTPYAMGRVRFLFSLSLVSYHTDSHLDKVFILSWNLKIELPFPLISKLKSSKRTLRAIRKEIHTSLELLIT